MGLVKRNSQAEYSVSMKEMLEGVDHVVGATKKISSEHIGDDNRDKLCKLVSNVQFAAYLFTSGKEGEYFPKDNLLYLEKIVCLAPNELLSELDGVSNKEITAMKTRTTNILTGDQLYSFPQNHNK